MCVPGKRRYFDAANRNIGVSMNRPHLPLNALRAFEASALHLSFTRAAIELCVTQAAVSHQVKNDGLQLGVPLFRRPPRDQMVTEEG